LSRAESPWLCPQKRIEKLADDEMFLRSFQSILNKITPQNFQVLAEKVLWLDINTKKRLTYCAEKILNTVSVAVQWNDHKQVECLHYGVLRPVNPGHITVASCYCVGELYPICSNLLWMCSRLGLCM
jgi:hypothetical protein